MLMEQPFRVRHEDDCYIYGIVDLTILKNSTYSTKREVDTKFNIIFLYIISAPNIIDVKEASHY